MEHVAKSYGKPRGTAGFFSQIAFKTAIRPMDLSNIELQGNAAFINDNYIRLTENKLFLSGQAFHNQSMAGNFETEFTFKIGIIWTAWK